MSDMVEALEGDVFHADLDRRCYRADHAHVRVGRHLMPSFIEVSASTFIEVSASSGPTQSHSAAIP